MIGLVSPFAGIHNLDLSPDSLSIADGAHQIWGQLTPHDDGSFDSVPVPDVGSSAIRTYQSEAEMRSYAQLFAQAALAAVETETDDLAPALNTNMPETGSSRTLNDLHSQIPIQLYPVLALVILAMYEYCQRGNVSRMRARGNQAITTAMDISIHCLDSTTTDYSEAQRRAWWMTVCQRYLLFLGLLLTGPVDLGHIPILQPPSLSTNCFHE
ncbi:uncharacterized protein N7500_000585 [Penicillium coprophilum]|uniref:uncharacterized protein n=1 Tax=Penicillium coprophilum TaxID=36646 RepID=UPI00239A1655|nr:uncharacterized protein N7500_000585 [Penicillium coprophilum]KAJ5177886.1 hypothetical protein N7500_000585 [Penicillium coprophilum]